VTDAYDYFTRSALSQPGRPWLEAADGRVTAAYSSMTRPADAAHAHSLLRVNMTAPPMRHRRGDGDAGGMCRASAVARSLAIFTTRRP
jgi:hypothetical protein